MQFSYKDVDSSRAGPQNYKRELSLHDAVSHLEYTLNGTTYRREYFTSFSDDVGMMQLKCPGSSTTVATGRV